MTSKSWTIAGLVMASAVCAVSILGCQKSDVKSDDDFLKEVRDAAATNTDPGSEVGNVPGTTESDDTIPVINVSTDYLDLGFIPTDGIGKGTVTVKNTGKAELIISDVKTSCGCTIGKMEKDVIEPGKEALLDVGVDPRRVYGFESTKVLTIFSNDPKNRSVQVKVHAKIKPEFELDPERVEFGEIEKGTSKTETVILRQAGDEELKLLDAAPQSSIDWMDVTYKERPEDSWKVPNHREYDITITIKDNAPVGAITPRVRIRPSFERVKQYMIPLDGRVSAFYAVTPTTVNMGPVTAGRKLENVFRVSSQQPFEIVSTSMKPPAVTLSYHPEDKDGHIIAFDATVNDTVPPGTFSGVADVVLKSGEKEYTENVRFLGVVQSPRPVEPAAEETKPVIPATPAAAAPPSAAPGATASTAPAGK